MEQYIPETGRSVPRADAEAKVTGAEKYAADHYGDDLLWAGVKRAGIPHGRILNVDTEKAAGIPGVIAVLTGKDVPGTNRQGIVHKDQPVLCVDKVRHCGDAVALIIAEDPEVLKAALSSIHMEMEPLPGVFSIDEALRKDSPLVHEEDRSDNILIKAVVQVGDALDVLETCPVVIEETFEVPVIAHAFLETENGVARQGPDGTITLVVSTQAPFRDRFEVSHALGIPMDRIRIIGPYLGGGFGGKDGATVQCFLALAARHAEGRPVKMWWDREESFLAGYKRHAARMHYRLGADIDGTLRALHCRLYFDTGAYAHLGGEVLALGMEHAGGPYRIPDTLTEGWCLYTNNPVAGAMRGFGVAQVSFAFESMMDLLAGKLGIDPLSLRLRNALRRGDKNCSGVTMTQSTGIKACLEALKGHPLWRKRDEWKAGAGLFRKRGVGISALFNAMGYGRGLPDSAIARVELTREGGIRVYNGVSDMGQGNSTAFLQIAGQLLRQENTSIELIQPDTATAYPSGSSAAGRTTYTYGNALIQACEELRKRILGWAALMLLADTPGDLELVPGRVIYARSGREISLRDIAAMMPDELRVAVSQFIMPVTKDFVDTGKEFRLGFPHLLFSHAAHLACVEVDELTGAVEVKEYLAATEGGRVLNPQCFHQQVEGSVAQGLGYALSEEVRLERGRGLTTDFATYIIPGAMDVPDITSIAVEDPEETGPFGLKGVGEVGLNGPLPAVANAVSDACGIRITRAPLTPERVICSMQGRPMSRREQEPLPAQRMLKYEDDAQRKGEVFLPRTLEELFILLDKEPEASLYAGGTDLLVKMRAGRTDPPALICLERLGELRGVREEGPSDLWLGACTTHTELMEHPLISKHLQVLYLALGTLGSPLIRNMGTVGGNICTASPAGDTLPPLYVLKAEVELRTAVNTRLMPIDEFITGPGRTRLMKGEVLAGVRVRKPEGFNVHRYLKVGQRKAMAISIAGMAALLKLPPGGVIEEARLAWGSVAPTVAVSPQVEALITGQRPSRDLFQKAAALVRDMVSPIDDIRATAEYRRVVSGNLLFRLMD